MIQFVHAVLRNALQTAVRDEIIPRNVAKLVTVTTPKYGVNRGLTVDQARDVLKAAKDERRAGAMPRPAARGAARAVVG
ncbi:hypothetical protein [Actinomadura madurae]|nr:hypothetical protein [Actinomadura madurae]